MPEFDNYKQRVLGTENASFGRPHQHTAIVGLGTFDETDGHTYVGLRVRGGVLLLASGEVDDLVRDLHGLQEIADRLNDDGSKGQENQP